MKILISWCLGMLIAVGAWAHGNDVVCRPGAGPNGLGIQAMRIMFDSENPNADVYILLHGRSYKIWSDVEGAGPAERITYRQGQLRANIVLKQGPGGMSANVGFDGVDTFSILDCRNRSRNR